jgi:hypothetical protein
MFWAVPVVAAANKGNKSVAVLVSLLMAEPPTDFQLGEAPL